MIVTGGRHYSHGTKVFEVLDEIKPAVIIQGGASGADAIARNWAQSHGVQVITYEYRESSGRGGGPVRNDYMIRDARADLVVAFPGGRGTADCVRRAKAEGIPVREIPEGSHVT